MAILTNPEGASVNGMSQETLVNHIIHIEAALCALSTKLDNDGGVTDTDYAADLQKIIVSGAIPLSDKVTPTSIIAEYDA